MFQHPRLDHRSKPWSLQSPWRPKERFGVMPSKGIQDIRVPESFPKTLRRCFPKHPGFPSLVTQSTCMPPGHPERSRCNMGARHCTSSLLAPANISHHCWRASQPLTLLYLNFGTSIQSTMKIFNSVSVTAFLFYFNIYFNSGGEGGWGHSSFQAELILLWGWASPTQLSNPNGKKLWLAGEAEHLGRL